MARISIASRLVDILPTKKKLRFLKILSGDYLLSFGAHFFGDTRIQWPTPKSQLPKSQYKHKNVQKNLVGVFDKLTFWKLAIPRCISSIN